MKMRITLVTTTFLQIVNGISEVVVIVDVVVLVIEDFAKKKIELLKTNHQLVLRTVQTKMEILLVVKFVVQFFITIVIVRMQIKRTHL